MLKINEIYKVNHSRKGIFFIKVIDDDDEWVKGTILEGETQTILPENRQGEGDIVRMRKSLCSFTRKGQ